MTPIRDLIDIPERVHRDDFVLRLAEGVAQPGETLRTHVITPQLADAFDRALSFLQGLLVILRDSGFSGLVVVLDEVETLQRVRSDVREKRPPAGDRRDRVDLHPDFDPRRDYALTLSDGELTEVERNACAALTPDDIALE